MKNKAIKDTTNIFVYCATMSANNIRHYTHICDLSNDILQ